MLTHATLICLSTFSEIEDLKDKLAKRDTQIDHLMNLLFDAIKQTNDVNAQFQASKIWSAPGNC